MVFIATVKSFYQDISSLIVCYHLHMYISYMHLKPLNGLLSLLVNHNYNANCALHSLAVIFLLLTSNYFQLGILMFAIIHWSKMSELYSCKETATTNTSTCSELTLKGVAVTNQSQPVTTSHMSVNTSFMQ